MPTSEDGPIDGDRLSFQELKELLAPDFLAIIDGLSRRELYNYLIFCAGEGIKVGIWSAEKFRERLDQLHKPDDERLVAGEKLVEMPSSRPKWLSTTAEELWR